MKKIKIMLLASMLCNSACCINVPLLQFTANSTGFLISATRIGEYLYAKMIQNNAMEAIKPTIGLDRSEKLNALETATNCEAFKDWYRIELISPTWKSVLFLWGPLLVVEAWLLSHDILQFKKSRSNNKKSHD